MGIGEVGFWRIGTHPKRKYKLLIIILISASFDGISSDETSFNIDGISYNDYLKDYYKNKKLLKIIIMIILKKNIR